MSHKITVSYRLVNFDKIESSKEFIELFINFAKTSSNQTDKLFKKYVRYIQKRGYSYESSMLTAIRALRLLADSRGPKTYDLICRTISDMKHLRYK